PTRTTSSAVHSSASALMLISATDVPVGGRSVQLPANQVFSSSASASPASLRRSAGYGRHNSDTCAVRGGRVPPPPRRAGAHPPAPGGARPTGGGRGGSTVPGRAGGATPPGLC